LQRTKTVKRFVRQEKPETSTVAHGDSSAAARGGTSMHNAKYL